jgi:hypothetical protein
MRILLFLAMRVEGAEQITVGYGSPLAATEV